MTVCHPGSSLVHSEVQFQRANQDMSKWGVGMSAEDSCWEHMEPLDPQKWDCFQCVEGSRGISSEPEPNKRLKPVRCVTKNKPTWCTERRHEQVFKQTSLYEAVSQSHAVLKLCPAGHRTKHLCSDMTG